MKKNLTVVCFAGYFSIEFDNILHVVVEANYLGVLANSRVRQ